MRLRVSTEVEPAEFSESVLQPLEARIVHHVHKGWFTVEIDADRLAQLRALRGVVGVQALPACDDRLDELPPDLCWGALAEGDCHGQLQLLLQAGEVAGRTVALRLRAEALQTCFVRAHRTAAIDIAVLRADGRLPAGQRVLARHSDGLRDRSVAGAHDWKAGEVRVITMWVGHLPPGEAEVEAGLLEGVVRVRGRLQTCLLRAPVRLGPASRPAPPGQGAA